MSFQYLLLYTQSHIALQCIFVTFSTSGWKECHLISSKRRARLKSQVAEHMSQLLPNQEDTNANTMLTKMVANLKVFNLHFVQIETFSQMFNEGCIDSLVMGTLNPLLK